jgi:hypothetical protein
MNRSRKKEATSLDSNRQGLCPEATPKGIRDHRQESGKQRMRHADRELGMYCQ